MFLRLWAWIASISLKQTEWICVPACIYILSIINSKPVEDATIVNIIRSCKAVIVGNMWNCFICTEGCCAYRIDKCMHFVCFVISGNFFPLMHCRSLLEITKGRFFCLASLGKLILTAFHECKKIIEGFLWNYLAHALLTVIMQCALDSTVMPLKGSEYCIKLS